MGLSKRQGKARMTAILVVIPRRAATRTAGVVFWDSPAETCLWFLLLGESHLVTIRVCELKKLYA